MLYCRLAAKNWHNEIPKVGEQHLTSLGKAYIEKVRTSYDYEASLSGYERLETIEIWFTTN